MVDSFSKTALCCYLSESAPLNRYGYVNLYLDNWPCSISELHAHVLDW